MSQILTYYKSLGSQGLLSGRYTQTPALEIHRGTKLGVLSLQISSLIPNVFVGDVTDTTSVRITTDGGVSWQIYTFSPGFYSISMINQALLKMLNHAGIAPDLITTNSPIIIGLNTATQQAFLTIDTTKAVAGSATQLGIDFAANDFGELLGFGKFTYINDGTFTAPNLALIDYQGSSIAVALSFGSITWLNGAGSTTLINIPVPYVMQGDIKYPGLDTLIKTPLIQPALPNPIMNFEISFINPRTNRDIVFLGGDVTLRLTLD